MSTNAIGTTKGISTTWSNWSGNLIHKGTDFYFQPTTKQALIEILSDAKKRGISLRVSGQRHSQTPLVAEDNRNATPPPNPTGYVVDMSCYIDIGDNGIQLGPNANQVMVNPGIREDTLDAFLTCNNLMMKTVTAGGFFSIGGMTAVDVHGGSIAQPIFAETASSFTLILASGEEVVIDARSTDGQGHSLLSFVRGSLGAFGIVTRITLDVAPRPFANTLQGGNARFLLADRASFIAKFKDLLTGSTKHDRIEAFYTPYAAAPNLPVVQPMENFLVLWWDEVANPSPQVPNTATNPEGACDMSHDNKFGAPDLGKLADFAAEYLRASQYYSSPYDFLKFPPVPTSGFVAIALDQIESQVATAHQAYSDLWLGGAIQVIFMSYFVELPAYDDVGLGKVWDGLAAVGDYVIQEDNFHIAAPLEFRFIRGGNAAMAGTFTANPDSYFVNFDLIGLVDQTPSTAYNEKLLAFFAMVERKWVEMGGLPHNGKMYGFYDPHNPDSTSYTPPFNANFLKFVTQRRVQRGAPIDAFRKYRARVDPDGRFYNAFLRNLLEE